MHFTCPAATIWLQWSEKLAELPVLCLCSTGSCIFVRRYLPRSAAGFTGASSFYRELSGGITGTCSFYRHLRFLLTAFCNFYQHSWNDYSMFELCIGTMLWALMCPFLLWPCCHICSCHVKAALAHYLHAPAPVIKIFYVSPCMCTCSFPLPNLSISYWSLPKPYCFLPAAYFLSIS